MSLNDGTFLRRETENPPEKTLHVIRPHASICFSGLETRGRRTRDKRAAVNDNEGLLLQQNIDTSPFRLDRMGSKAATLMACVLMSRVLWMRVRLLGPICSTDVSRLTGVLGRFDDPLLTVVSKLLSLIHLQIRIDSGDFAEDSLMFLQVPYESPPTPHPSRTRLWNNYIQNCWVPRFQTLSFSSAFQSHTHTESIYHWLPVHRASLTLGLYVC